MKNRHGGYITADEYPRLIFYCVMCGIYALFAILWFIWCTFYWHELLKIQFLIGGFILIAMIEKLALLVEFDTVNRHGYKVHLTIVTAEVLSCLKRTVLRMLVIIIAVDYDIVKSRLGSLKQKVLAMKSDIFDSVIIYKTTNIENGSTSKNEKQQQISSNHETKISVSGVEASNDNDVVENALIRIENNIQTSIFDQAIDSEYKIVNNELARSTMQ
ncbi:unnamed protein product [Rotaria sordida]|uniref:GOST seven transmembrane domain-containing protein n=1 Tax=Rotaria sordida TaxID=392033 RepID=A0A814EJ78_9BILA|nr:unnamed protein product [Rotaria sordida]